LCIHSRFFYVQRAVVFSSLLVCIFLLMVRVPCSSGRGSFYAAADK
jgi:hypothetical protein